MWAILPHWWRWRFATCCLCFCSPLESFTPGFLGSFFLSRNNNKGVHFYHCCTFSLDLCCYIFLISYVHVMLGFLRQIDIWTFEIHFWNLNCLLQFWLKLWRLRNRTQIVLLNPENNKIYFHSIADSVQTEYCPTFLLSVCSSVRHRRDISHFSHI